MKFINCSYSEFIKFLNDREIIQFGASSAWHYFFGVFPDIEKEIVEKTLFIVDNSTDKQGQFFQIGKKKLNVLSPVSLKTDKSYVILITVSLAYHESICKQLLDMDFPENTEVYSLFLMTSYHDNVDNSIVDSYFENHKEEKIPARIHSFWFSGEEKPKLYQKCLDSWHRLCPDFEIIEWNCDNYDVTKNKYMHEAIKSRKWAFASDYARLDVLKQYGGIYMDMDVELLASIRPLLCAESFFCRQEDGMLELGSGFGVQKNDPLICKMLDAYTGRSLFLPDGTMDMTPQPEFLSGILLDNGFINSHDSQVIGERLILSNDYISCYTGAKSSATGQIGIHWHNAGWLPEKDRKLIKRSLDVKDKLISEYFVSVP